MMDFIGKKVLIVGRGVSGRGAFDALRQLGADCSFYSTEADFDGVELVIVSPGVPASDKVFGLARRKKIAVIGELELGFLLCDKPVIAITGTNGKTTITELVGKILECDGKKPLVSGNIGIAFSSAALKTDYDIAVVEASSFQLETISSFAPHVAIISNITEDHLDRHKTMEKYASAKFRIAKNQTSSDYLLITSGVKEFLPLEAVSSKVCCIDEPMEDSPICCLKEEGIFFGDTLLAQMDDISIKGRHNFENACLAASAAKLFGASDEAIRQGLRLFAPRSFRVALSGEHDGKKYYNDSKGTNIDACLSACKAMQGATCLILGGSDKGYSFDRLFLQLPKTIKKIYAVGQTAGKILKSAARCGFLDIEKAASIKQATILASRLEVCNVLLSPAAASFDRYANYEERGRDFDRVVGEIMQAGDAKWS